MGSYNSACIDNNCYQDCCNMYGFCPDSSSTDPWANSCEFYYNQVDWLSWFIYIFIAFFLCIAIAACCAFIKKRNNQQQAVINYGNGSGYQYNQQGPNQYSPPNQNQQGYHPAQYGQPYFQGQNYQQNQPTAYQGQNYGNPANYGNNPNSNWQRQNQPVIGQPVSTQI